MSSDEDDGEQRMRFTDTNDFTGGKWVGGEYYYENKITGKTQSKDERIYGVFQDGSSDEDEKNKRRKKGRKQGDTRGDFTKPLNFVSSKSDQPTKRKPEKEKWIKQDERDIETEPGSDMDEDEDEELPPGVPPPVTVGTPAPEEVANEGAATKEQFRTLLQAAGGIGVKRQREKDGAGEPTDPAAGSTAQGGGVSKVTVTRAVGSASGPRSNADFKAFLLQGLGAAAAAKGGSGDAGEPEERGVSPTPESRPSVKRAPAKLDSNFGNWERHTKGIGQKLLLKMGFKGRLGKEESGVTRQLEVKVRPGGIGLGFGNFKEATTLKTNREIEADRQGKTLEELEAELGIVSARKPKEKSPAEASAEQGLWRKDAKGRKKTRRYVTAEELLKMQQQGGKEPDAEGATVTQKQVIVDMRGPQVKLVGSLEEIDYEDQGMYIGTEAEKPKLGQELLHNVDLMVNLAEQNIHNLSRRVAVESNRVSALEKDVADLRVKVEAGGERLARIEQVSQLLDRVHSKIATDASSITADALLRVFRTLRENYPDEYTVFGLAQLAPSLAAPILKRTLGAWDPLTRPMEIVSILASWKPVLTRACRGLDADSAADGGEDEDALILSNGGAGFALAGRSLQAQREGEAAFAYLVEQAALPRIRHVLTNEWDVRDPAPAVKLMETLRPLIPAELVGSLLEQTVLSKISRAVGQWNPRTDTVAVHLWTHPWLPLLGNKLATLFPEIRRKLSAVLLEWTAQDESAYIMLRPWAGVFDPRSMEALLVKSIMPQLVSALRDQLVIDPRNQVLGPFNWVMRWHDIMPPLHFVSLLEGEFFSKWMTVLYQWLTNAPDFAEVAQWYQGWKSLFPPAVQADPRVVAQFNAALQLMDQVMQDHEQRGVPMPPGTTEQMSYMRVVEMRRMEALAQRQAQAQLAPAVPPQHKGGTGSSTFKEVVQVFAEQNGVAFMPRPAQQHNGKQIYSFGGVRVYLENSVAFVEASKGSGQWSPVSLEDLLDYAQNT